MLQARKNVFETNSSSTHSITLCSQDEYDDWCNGKLLLNEGWWSNDNASEFKNKKFVTREQAEDIIRNDADYNGEDLSKLTDEQLGNWYDDDGYIHEGYGIYTCYGYVLANATLEFFKEKYITQSGDGIVAFGYYGYDY